MEELFFKSMVRFDVPFDEGMSDIRTKMDEALADAIENGWNREEKTIEGSKTVTDLQLAAESLVIQLYVAFNLLKSVDNVKKYEISWADFCKKVGLRSDTAERMIEKWIDPEGYKAGLDQRRKERQGQSTAGAKAQKVLDKTEVSISSVDDEYVDFDIFTAGASSIKRIPVKELEEALNKKKA